MAQDLFWVTNLNTCSDVLFGYVWYFNISEVNMSTTLDDKCKGALIGMKESEEIS